MNARSESWHLTQPLFRYEIWQAYAQAKRQAFRAHVLLALAHQGLMLRVATVYFDILIAQENLAATEAKRTAIGEQLNLAKRNLAVKAGMITDVHEVQARHDLAQARYLAAVEKLETKRVAPGQLIGVVPVMLSPLKSDVALPTPQPPDIRHWLDAAKENNLNIHASRVAVEAANRKIKRQMAGHYPRLDHTASHGSTTARAASYRQRACLAT